MIKLDAIRRHVSHRFMGAALVAFFLGLLVGPGASHATGHAEDQRALARAGVKKLALEAYPRWMTRPGNAGRCPTVQDLAEHGGSVKDPYGEAYRVRCDDLPPGAVGIAVWSTSEDRRDGTADDVTSWED